MLISRTCLSLSCLFILLMSVSATVQACIFNPKPPKVINKPVNPASQSSYGDEEASEEKAHPSVKHDFSRRSFVENDIDAN